MRVRWYGQSAFLLTDEDDNTVFIDPFGDMTAALAGSGLTFAYPQIEGVSPDLLIVTHEHGDHNAVEVIGGTPVVLRSTAGRHDSPVGEVVAIASEHDDVAGTARGPNTIHCFSFGGLRVCHLGDLGQAALRPEQIAAIGDVDVLIIPAGDGPTVGGERAAAVVRALAPRLVIPMHYGTPLADFLEPPDAFLEALGARVEQLETSEAEIDALLGTRDAPTVAVFATPKE